MKKWLKLALLFLVLFFVFVILHNLIYALFKFEEAIIFSSALIVAGLFFGSILYVLILFVKKLIQK